MNSYFKSEVSACDEEDEYSWDLPNDDVVGNDSDEFSDFNPSFNHQLLSLIWIPNIETNSIPEFNLGIVQNCEIFDEISN